MQVFQINVSNDEIKKIKYANILKLHKFCNKLNGKSLTTYHKNCLLAE